MKAVMIKRLWFTLLFLVLYGWVYSQQKVPDTKLRVIDGYTDKFAYSQGEKCMLFINASGKGTITLRLMSADNMPVDTVQMEVVEQKIVSKEPYSEGFGYQPTFFYTVPKLKSGLYTWEGTKIRFLVKTAKKKTDLVIVYPSNTEQAYSVAGGKSFYANQSTNKKATPKVSFLRPFTAIEGHFKLLDGFVRWIETTHYNYNFISDVDMDDYSNISKSKIIVVIGHSEYWTRKARQNFDRFVRSGKHAIVLSGNTMWWQVRYNKEKTEMICFKDAKTDTLTNDPLMKTILWNDPSLKYPIPSSIGMEMAGYGKKVDKGWNGFKIISPDSPLLKGTGLKQGEILPCASGEIDGVAIKPYNPDKYPEPDSTLPFRRIEIIAFDRGTRDGKEKETIHTFIAFQATKKSGRVINVGSTDWCSVDSFYGAHQQKFRQITSNMIDLLLSGKDIFSPAKKNN